MQKSNKNSCSNSLKKQKINIKNGFRKLNISEALYFKIVNMSTILWPPQLVLDANLFGFLETPLC